MLKSCALKSWVLIPLLGQIHTWIDVVARDGLLLPWVTELGDSHVNVLANELIHVRRPTGFGCRPAIVIQPPV
jgi:hypothetical protein